MKKSKTYSTIIPRLYIYFAVATFIGAAADWLLLSSTFQDMDIGSPIAELFQTFSNLSQYDSLIATVISFVLALCICLLAVVFMFKSGSSSVEESVREINISRNITISAEHLLMIIWILLGSILTALRLYYGILVKPDNNAIPLSFLLLVLYIGTGITSYLLGQVLGDPCRSKYRKIKRDLDGIYINDLTEAMDRLNESNTNCINIQRDLQNVLQKYTDYYDIIDSMVEEYLNPPMISNQSNYSNSRINTFHNEPASIINIPK
ncbi:MAG: hypothetical protein LBN03_01305 [Bifidobacteriaceae bacterium]|jgi:hypothetical protein|nr:hypothetical protein [Bifidobacteriaceae bacterium]